jgi:outer membrane protein OmpA-like peptidoglycan-associated protein
MCNYVMKAESFCQEKISIAYSTVRRLSLFTIAACLLLSFAQPQTALANVVGSDAQNFNPITSGIDFLTVQSSETLVPGILNLGLFANYAKNTFPYYQDVGSSSTRTERNNSLLGGDFNLGLGLGKNWDIGLSFPFILQQEVSDSANVGHYSSTGNTEIRFNTKYRFFGNQNHGLAIIASSNFNRIAGSPYVGEGGGPIVNFEIAGDMTVSQVALALNLGYRLRNPGTPVPDTGIEPMPNQLIGSAAMSYHMSSIDTKIIAEVLTAFPEKAKLKGATDQEYSVMEALLGLKHDMSSNLSMHLGAGTSIVKGVSSPDYRLYTGLNYTFGPLFGKKPQKSVQSDPYYENDQLVRFQRKKAVPNPRVVENKKPLLKPSQTTVTKSPPVVARPTPAPTPEDDSDIEVTVPAVKVETVHEVKVFDRGSYNHIVLNSIEFKPGSNELKSESERYLIQELTPALRDLNHRRPVASIVVEGHTDSVGSAQSNLALSQERARTVASILRKNLGLNIPIQAVGLGATSPIADNGNYQGRALNRRVEFKLIYQRTVK